MRSNEKVVRANRSRGRRADPAASASLRAVREMTLSISGRLHSSNAGGCPNLRLPERIHRTLVQSANPPLSRRLAPLYGHSRPTIAGPAEGQSMPAPPPPKRHPYNQWSPDARALDLVGDKWTLLIVRDLASGPRRFVELQRVLPGISTEQLRSRLNRMVADGLLTRQRYREVPPRVDYEL